MTLARTRGYQAREGSGQEYRIGCRLSPDGTWNSQTPISPGSKPRQNLQPASGFMRNNQSPAAGVDSTRLKHHWGKACLSPAPLPERQSYEASEMFDADDGWSESSATVPAGLDSTRVHPSIPLKWSWDPNVRPMPGTTCIMDTQKKKRVPGPQTIGDPLAQTGDVVEACGKTWRRMAYSHAGAQQNWKLKNTNKRLDLSQSLSPQSFNPDGSAGLRSEWTYSKPQYYNTCRNEPKYFVAGAEDSCPASARMDFKVLQRSAAERGASAEVQAQRGTHTLSRQSSMRSVQSDYQARGDAKVESRSGLSRSLSAQESSVDTLRGGRRSPNIVNTLPLRGSSGGYPAHTTSSSTGSARPKYERAQPGTTIAPLARGSSTLEKSSGTHAKIVPRSPLTWEQTETISSPGQRSLQQSGARDGTRGGGREGRLATARQGETPRGPGSTQVLQQARTR